jgi:hypothetical protein
VAVCCQTLPVHNWATIYQAACCRCSAQSRATRKLVIVYTQTVLFSSSNHVKASGFCFVEKDKEAKFACYLPVHQQAPVCCPHLSCWVQGPYSTIPPSFLLLWMLRHCIPQKRLRDCLSIALYTCSQQLAAGVQCQLQTDWGFRCAGISSIAV